MQFCLVFVGEHFWLELESALALTFGMNKVTRCHKSSMPGQEITRLRGSEGTITNTLYPPFGREFDLSVVSALLRC